MRTRLVTISLIIILGISLWFLQYRFPNDYLTKAFNTSLALLIIYLVIKVVLEQVVAKKIRDPKTRYSLKRMASMLAVLTFIAATITIWVDNLQALLVSYGILAAGAAVALQD